MQELNQSYPFLEASNVHWKMPSVRVVTTIKCALLPLTNALSALREGGRKEWVICLSKKTQSQSKGLVFKFKVLRLPTIQRPIIILSKKTEWHCPQLLGYSFTNFCLRERISWYLCSAFEHQMMLLACATMLSRQFCLQKRLFLVLTGQRNIEFELRSLNYSENLKLKHNWGNTGTRIRSLWALSIGELFVFQKTCSAIRAHASKDYAITKNARHHLQDSAEPEEDAKGLVNRFNGG